jgi:hypothetical protein
MRRLYKGALAGLGLVGLAGGAVVAQQATGVNPPANSIWTYLGPTFGAGWAPPFGQTSCVNIAVYGAVGDGVVDNTAAFNAAKAVTRCLVFPAGKFRFNSALSYTMTTANQSVTIRGEGQEVTELYFPNAVGTALLITTLGPDNSFHVRDLAMTTGTIHTDTALYVQNNMTAGTVAQSGYAGSDVTRVTFRSDQGYAQGNTGTPITHGWLYGFTSNKVSMIDFAGVQVYGPTPGGAYHGSGGTGGTGIQVGSSDPNIIPVIFNFSRINVGWVENGIVYGNYVQGVQITQSNFVGCWAGIQVPAGLTGLAGLLVSNSQFNNQYGILMLTAVPQFQVVNSMFYVADNGTGIEDHDKSFVTQITGNSFMGAHDLPAGPSTGISFTPSILDLVPAVITGNTFYRLGTGVNFGSNVDGIIVAANIFSQNTLNVQNAATTAHNQLTGSVPAATMKYATVSGAANVGGLVRLTVNSTAGFVNGEMVLVTGVGGIGGIGTNQASVTNISIPDSTHMDLNSIAFSGAYTNGGYLTSLPP